MTAIEDLLKRVEALEREVAELRRPQPVLLPSFVTHVIGVDGTVRRCTE